MALVQQREQVNLALSRLLEQFKGKPRIEGVVRSYVKQLDNLEDAYFDLLNERSISTAIGSQLDILGALVNEKRLGRSDTVYRLAILTRIGINNSEGTPNQIMSLLKSLTQGTKIKMWEHYPVSGIYYTNTKYEDNIGVADTLQLISPATSGNVTVIFDPDNVGFLPADSILQEFIIVDENGNFLTTGVGTILVTDTGDTLIFNTGETILLAEGEFLGELIIGQVWSEEDEGDLELAILSEMIPTTLDVEVGILVDLEALAGEPFMEAGEPIAVATPVVGAPEGLLLSCDGITEEVMEIWSATALETTESPYGIALEAAQAA